MSVVNDGQKKMRSFLAVLHPWAASLNMKPHLANITLANILAGDTCSPISLTDYEKYLTYIEYSVENLQFLVWFQDYRKRYSKSRRTPCHREFAFSMPTRARTERMAAESLARIETNHNLFFSNAPTGSEPETFPSPADTNASLASPTSPMPLLPPRYISISLPPPVHPITRSFIAEEKNPFAVECSHVVATFLSPGAVKELALDAIVRDTVIRNLSSDCNPDVFLPVYEEVYNLLEMGSLPKFLSAATSNINLPKQIYWYIVGVTNVVIGLIIASTLIVLLPTPPDAHRAWRIFSAGFASLGAAQIYSAWRGYCSQVWMRGNTQIRVWELQEMDEEAKTFVSRVLGIGKRNTSLRRSPCRRISNSSSMDVQEKSNRPSLQDEDKGQRQTEKPHDGIQENEKQDESGNLELTPISALPAVFPTPPLTCASPMSPRPSRATAEIATIAPFAVGSSDTVPTYSSAVKPGASEGGDLAPGAVAHSRFRRPPIFGPETVVQDPRIKAVHKQVLLQIVWFGVLFLLAYSAIIFSVPSRKRA